MLELHDIIEIEYRGGHVYWIRFEDGTEGEIDFSDYTSKVESFADLALFRQAKVEAGTIAWPGGVDLAPETLYDRLRQQSAQPARHATDDLNP